MCWCFFFSKLSNSLSSIGSWTFHIPCPSRCLLLLGPPYQQLIVPFIPHCFLHLPLMDGFLGFCKLVPPPPLICKRMGWGRSSGTRRALEQTSLLPPCPGSPHLFHFTSPTNLKGLLPLASRGGLSVLVPWAPSPSSLTCLAGGRQCPPGQCLSWPPGRSEWAWHTIRWLMAPQHIVSSRAQGLWSSSLWEVKRLFALLKCLGISSV